MFIYYFIIIIYYYIKNKPRKQKMSEMSTPSILLYITLW